MGEFRDVDPPQPVEILNERGEWIPGWLHSWQQAVPGGPWVANVRWRGAAGTYLGTRPHEQVRPRDSER